jgi:hypothetical protein
VVATLIRCPNHAANSIPRLPLDAEEQLATRYLNPRTGIAGTRVGKLEGEEKGFPAQNYRYRASSQIGEGVEWHLFNNNPWLEFRRTRRQLKQRTRTETEQLGYSLPGEAPQYTTKTIYLNEFEVEEEQTSYYEFYPPLQDFHQSKVRLVMEVNLDTSQGLYKCHPLDRNPYLSLLRFEKVSHYRITQKNFKGRYKPMGSATGMVSAPYGVTWSGGTYKQWHPETLILDPQGTFRDENGERLEQPKSTWRRLLTDLDDFFGRTSKSSFGYSIPAWDILALMSKQPSVRTRIPGAVLVTGGLGLIALALKRLSPHGSSKHHIVSTNRARRLSSPRAGHELAVNSCRHHSNGR